MTNFIRGGSSHQIETKGGAGSRMTAGLSFYEFFAGGGMARAGLGPNWTCLFANDNSPLKAAAYNARWGEGELDARGVDEITSDDLPRGAQLAWASFPCQDISIAGSRRGVGAKEDRTTRSSALWPFVDLMADLKLQGSHPAVIVLENVTGLLTSNSGRDFVVICEALADIGYDFGAVIVDAKHFVPQSRPRIFLIASREDLPVPSHLTCEAPARPWHSPGIVNAHASLPSDLVRRWKWWALGDPPELDDGALLRAIDLSDDAKWHTPEETKRLLAMMSETHRARLAGAKLAGKCMIGSLYMRMRPSLGGNVQRTEITFSSTLGCLRTPGGGASRPRIVVVQGEKVRTRLLSPREAADLMGLPREHPLPANYQHAFQLIGDGVVAPVVGFIRQTLIEPLALIWMEILPKSEICDTAHQVKPA